MLAPHYIIHSAASEVLFSVTWWQEKPCWSSSTGSYWASELALMLHEPVTGSKEFGYTRLGFCCNSWAGIQLTKLDLVITFIKYSYQKYNFFSIFLLEVMLCSVLHASSSTLQVHHYLMLYTTFDTMTFWLAASQTAMVLNVLAH